MQYLLGSGLLGFAGTAVVMTILWARARLEAKDLELSNLMTREAITLIRKDLDRAEAESASLRARLASARAKLDELDTDGSVAVGELRGDRVLPPPPSDGDSKTVVLDDASLTTDLP